VSEVRIDKSLQQAATANQVQKVGQSLAHLIEQLNKLLPVRPAYAANFRKGLGASDILYYAKVHHERNRETGKEDLHAHIIVSRKDVSNKLKLSPATNHRGTQKGAVKGGFDREACSHL
jgi:hypothetical protein